MMVFSRTGAQRTFGSEHRKRKADDRQSRVSKQTLSDEELVEFARQGGENAIRLLVKRNNRRLFRVARAVVRDDAEAEGIVQETYLSAFTKLASFRGHSRFSTWLTRIALNEALGRARKRRPSAELAELDISDGVNGGSVIMFPTSLKPPGADAELARTQVRNVLETAVDELPDPFRLVFILRDIEEMSTEDTCEPAVVETGNGEDAAPPGAPPYATGGRKAVFGDIFRTLPFRRRALRRDSRSGGREVS